MIVALDSTPAFLMTNRSGHTMGDRCRSWAKTVEDRGDVLALPAIVYYEVRRELFLRRARTRLRLLEQLRQRLAFLDIDLETLDLASELWARARAEGKPTADDASLDADVLIAAQAILAGAVVATGNVGHLSVYCDAAGWDSL